ncbi:hypothetical protein K402DRAFT_396206 [Aulographum hederae CBS 113979]|uniref:Uncharacterized protein n=1 Tax=Aulographum hederae CBS 113979 TaxID=1176131 RepID=A0A6G1GTA0_9PEZI|nr:hypothetical protein K402DRAFT_396206 [Aulographum hederae CBS 113979]
MEGAEAGAKDDEEGERGRKRARDEGGDGALGEVDLEVRKERKRHWSEESVVGDASVGTKGDRGNCRLEVCETCHGGQVVGDWGEDGDVDEDDEDEHEDEDE